MKNKLNIFNGLLLILFNVGCLIAQTPTSTRIPMHDRLQSKRDREERIEAKAVAVKMDGNRLLGVRSLGEKKELHNGEIEAKAATDGDSMIIALETRFNNLDKLGLAIEKEIVLDEETSKYLGSNVFSILDGKYKLESNSDKPEALVIPIHHFLRTLFNPQPTHNMFRTFRKDSDAIAAIVEVEVRSLKNSKDTPRSVLVTIKDKTLLNIKLASGTEKIENKDIYSAKASFLNTQLVLEFDKPLSRQQKIELNKKGDLISDKETRESLGVCGCSDGIYLITNANTNNPTLTLPVAAGKARHRWLFNKTSYGDPSRCSYPANSTGRKKN